MNDRQLSAILIGLLTATAVGVLALLFRSPRAVSVDRRVADVAAETRAGTFKPDPTMAATATEAPKAPASAAPEKLEAPIVLSGKHETFEGRPGPASSNWPRFRGPLSDNRCLQETPLAERWPVAGPPVLWSVALSEGHGGAAVWNGSVYLMDYMEALESDAVRCFSFADGREIWRHSYKCPTKRNHGVSRTVPAVSSNYVVAMGPRCHVVCLDREAGTFKWGVDLVRDHGTEVPLWYTGQCPLIDDGVAVLAPAGSALLMGVDCATGEIAWRTPNPDGWKMTHSSVMPMTLLGRRMYVYCALGGVVGVSAEGADRGKVLWKSAAWTQSVLAPSPVRVDDARVFLTAGYGGGSMMLGLKDDGGQIRAEPLLRLEKTVFACEQQSPILQDGLLFSVLPKDAGELRGQFGCIDPSGKPVWMSGMTERFGLGPFLFADGKFLILNDTGELTLARASKTGFEKLARARVLRGRDAWAPMALVDGRLLLRDSEQLVCLDVRASIATHETAAKP